MLHKTKTPDTPDVLASISLDPMTGASRHVYNTRIIIKKSTIVFLVLDNEANKKPLNNREAGKMWAPENWWGTPCIEEKEKMNSPYAKVRRASLAVTRRCTVLRGLLPIGSHSFQPGQER